MIHDIRDAFNDLLEENDWMDTETRKGMRILSARGRFVKYHSLIVQ